MVQDIQNELKLTLELLHLQKRLRPSCSVVIKLKLMRKQNVGQQSFGLSYVLASVSPAIGTLQLGLSLV
ncbi:hypothetical protein LX32DRAFT_287157 [Colletotrichum zoysiae]|uniref:Uncharacterized protein n=1 Tax=Colletotrichum zoysiae TaxID=1216348 RepID=A0AAD9H1V0_9PEZI|nr:hypothetical protein LX32DRAFT_287157 [Colletotrichum zoysiae]